MKKRLKLIVKMFAVTSSAFIGVVTATMGLGSLLQGCKHEDGPYTTKYGPPSAAEDCCMELKSDDFVRCLRQFEQTQNCEEAKGNLLNTEETSP